MKMYKLVFPLLASMMVIFITPSAIASNFTQEHKQLVWPFEGDSGTFDRQAAQRGAQVYMEVCSACHGLNHLYYRNLKDLGFSDAEVKEIAAKKDVKDGPNDVGEMFDRPATPSDRFALPYPNSEAARAANNGALPVDLSLIVKARHDGANYLYSLLTGYQEPPEHIKMMPGLNYNPYFEGGQIAMPSPLSEGQVTFMDGTPASVDQMARDVTIFLQWVAEPEMEHRKSMGLKLIVKPFVDPLHWIRTLPAYAIDSLKKFHANIDWRRSFITTEINKYYDSFVRYQFNKLKSLGYLDFGKRYSIYCTIDNQACLDHDRRKGEGFKPIEVIMRKVTLSNGDILLVRSKNTLPIE